MKRNSKLASRNSQLVSAFTLIELLIVIAILSLLAQLVLPALNIGRESSRRATCTHHLSRIGAAIQAYHESHDELPPAAEWGWDISPFDIDGGTTDANWTIYLLPHLDEQMLSSMYDSTNPISDPANKEFRITHLEVMSCPSDAYNRADNLYFRNFQTGRRALPQTYARGNYAINGGAHARCDAPGHPGMPCASGYQVENKGVKQRGGETYRRWGIGIAGINKSFSFDEFANGLSRTVALDEIRAGIHPLDPRGVWSAGQVGMSITWAHGIHGDAVGPNNCAPESDDILGCNILYEIVGIDKLVDEKMGCCDHCHSGNDQAGARSMHPGGVHVLMCDGSVHFTTDEIDQSIWHVMHSRENSQAFEMPL